VELFIHPAFSMAAPLAIDLNTEICNLEGINHFINSLIVNVWGGIAGNSAEYSQDVVNQCISIVDVLDGNQVGGIAGGIARVGIDDEFLNSVDRSDKSDFLF
jgi:hypothetical protein